MMNIMKMIIKKALRRELIVLFVNQSTPNLESDYLSLTYYSVQNMQYHLPEYNIQHDHRVCEEKSVNTIFYDISWAESSFWGFQPLLYL